ncbi:unnamed protein product [Microthlaspi erraticum]|uniref:Glycosyltransferase n=1 Tax=Microthlaspi erraticum TaxID=1685480 RepID=A0A6D2L6C7_9BRAS|nr:unnamed protein product [Microthlaspi erraticum]
MIPYVHLANKLAEKGHLVTFLLPKKAKLKLEPLSLFPDSIVFEPLTVPHVDGLPVGAETTADVPNPTGNYIYDAMALLRGDIEAKVRALKPDVIFFDFADWVPEMAKEFGVKSVNYQIVSAVSTAMALAPGAELGHHQPPGYPSSKMVLRGYDATLCSLFASSCSMLLRRIANGLKKCDVISIRTCAELEGEYIGFIERECQKKVLLSGPLLPELQEIAFMEKEQFQELCLGMELTGLPFLAAVKPPKGSSTTQVALPEGFEERVKGRGIIWGEWLDQPLILSHRSVGCFVNHCGFGTMWESLVRDVQIVHIPQLYDQALTTRLCAEELEVSVKVQREDSGWFSKESLRDAVNSVMDKDSEIGNLVKRNHKKLRETLVSPGFFSGYADQFVEALENEVNNMESS